MSGDWHSDVWLLTFALWPAVVLVAALVNMLISWTFSWQELISCYLIGAAIGLCFFYGTSGSVMATLAPGATPDEPLMHTQNFFLVAATGFFGLLKLAGVDALQDPATLFWVTSSAVVGSTACCGGWDRLACHIGNTQTVGGGVYSIVGLLFKLPFALVTTAVGLLLALIGMFVALGNGNGGAAFLGGQLWAEWGMGPPGVASATTFSSVVMVWQGKVRHLMAHEMYHTRQYIYLQDFLGVYFFTIGALWGLISASTKSPYDASFAFRADGEVGNPLEVAPYKQNWSC